MLFEPMVGQELFIDDVAYCVTEHPAAPDTPYGQEGRQSIVYQLSPSPGQKVEAVPQALKVFKPRYRVPAFVSLAQHLAPFADLPGLQVCRRTVLTPHRHEVLLRQYRDLTYAVLMPWVEGPTWMEVILRQRALQAAESLQLATSLVEVLVGMEQATLAHCDLSGPNPLLPALDGGEGVALVDVEQMYAPDLGRPALLPSGSPGYAHKTAEDSLWSAEADRFSGAVLLAEVLAWCDQRAREAAWGENYFEPGEMQEDCPRFQVLNQVLRERWGEDVAAQFERAWRSDTLADCATFGEWLVTLPRSVPVPELHTAEPDHLLTEDVPDADATMRRLLDRAHQLEGQGNRAAALEAYREAHSLAVAGSNLELVLARLVEGLETESVVASAGDTFAADDIRQAAAHRKLSDVPEERFFPAAPTSRASMLRSIFLVFVAGAVGLYVSIHLLEDVISQTRVGPWDATAEVQRQVVSNSFLAVLMGAIEAWTFRERVRSRRRLQFVAATMVGGVLGGVVAGVLLNQDISRTFASTAAIGAAAGAVTGGIAGLGQSRIIRAAELGNRWFAWKTVSWALIWAIGRLIGREMAGIGGLAASAAFILVAAGISASLLFHIHPEIEF